MLIENFTPIPALIGGVLIGIASVVMMLFNGKITGVSGITKGLILGDCVTAQERFWRMAFLGGLVLGGAGIIIVAPDMTAVPLAMKPVQMAIGGLLVGFGTAMGNGCTSGHGVCGLGRRSTRSLGSVLTFIGTGMLTMFVMTQILQIARF